MYKAKIKIKKLELKEGDLINKLMPSIQDKEIYKQNQDSFGHIHFAQALESLIESPNNQPPFTIGLLGKWGVGKSSIKELYKYHLNDDKTEVTKGTTRGQKIELITFNAWRFGGENLKRSLLRHVYLELGGNEESLKEKLFKQISRPKTESKSCLENIKQYFNLWAGFLIHFLLLLIFLCIVSVSIIGFSNITTDWVKSIIVGSVCLAGYLFLKYMMSNPKDFIPSFLSNTMHIEFPATSVEEYEDMLLGQMRIYNSTHKLCERIVIFVDDLDRLPPEEMINGIDAIRSFMEIPQSKLPEGLGIIFVVSCDEEKVSQALSFRNFEGAIEDSHIEWNLNTEARRYLDRIFQFRLEIPPFPKRDMRQFATQKLSSDLREIYEQLVKSDVSIEELIDRMIHPAVQSPRNAIHILNEFAQSWWIACKREKEGAGTNKPGGLREGTITQNSITLGIMCVLKVDFPKFYCDLQKYPNLINQFINVFLRDMNFSDQPQSIQSVLKAYCNKENKLDKKYYSLATYLSGLAGHQWPPSLLPFLMLTQDSVSRNEQNDGLQDYLVQADYQGVLRVLGRNLDNKVFSEAQMRLLHDILEDIQQETLVKKNNAAVALSNLVGRYPLDNAQLIIGPLARQIIDNQRLRWMIGVEKTENIVNLATIEQQKDIASVLIKDLLKQKGDIDFKLENMQTPSVSEAIRMVKVVCGLVLRIRQQHGLEPDCDRTLLDWLMDRHVSINEYSENLPFTDLEFWLSDHEDHLLKDIGTQYIDVISDKLKANDTIDINMKVVLRRCRSVFDSLASKGEEYRPHLWKLLNQFVTVVNKDAVKLSWETMLKHQINCPSEVLSQFIGTLSERLNEDIIDEENWSLDRQEGAKAIITLVSNNLNMININSPMDQLVIHWSRIEECDNFASSLAELLLAKKSPILEEILKDWSNNVLLDLRDLCRSWLAKHFGVYSEDIQNGIVAQLKIMTIPNSVTEGNSKKYKYFIKEIPYDIFYLPIMAQHINAMYSAIQQNFNNSAYVKEVFDTVLYTVNIAPKNEAGAMLVNTFSQSVNNSDIFSWLHSRMCDNWPALNEIEYDIKTIFSVSYSFVINNPSYGNTYLVLNSIVSMITKEIMQPDKRTIAAAIKVWPYHKEAAHGAFLSQKLLPSSEDIVQLADYIDINKNEEINILLTTWTYFGTLIELEQSVEVLRIILNRPAKNANIPDIEIALWIKASLNHKLNLLLDGIIIGDLNDEQRKRIWLQIENDLNDLKKQQVLDLLKTLFKLPNIPNTIQAVFNSQNVITETMRNSSGQNELALCLLVLSHICNSQEYKNRLMQWAKAIQASNVLSQYLENNEIDNEEIELLKNYFPDSPVLRKDTHLKIG